MSKPSFDYQQKKERERQYYRRRLRPRGLGQRIVHHRLVFDQQRVNFNYVFPKQQMARMVRRNLPARAERLLIAPCGTGADLEYLGELAGEVHGIDLSPEAVAQCPPPMAAKVGDVLESGYPDGWFDLIASPLFFHHLQEVGFGPFLREFHRLLRPGGGVVILEPSVWYPLNVVTRPLKRLLDNPFSEVEDEDPLPPDRLVGALRRGGFVDVRTRAASFSHCAFYVPLAKAVNRLTRPLLGLWPIKHMAWMVAFWARKPLPDKPGR